MKLLLEVAVVLGYLSFGVSWQAVQVKHMRSEFVKEATPEDGRLLLCRGAFRRGNGRLGADGFAIWWPFLFGLRKDSPPVGN